MKKLMLSLLIISGLAAGAHAQTDTTAKAHKSKADKQAVKAKKDDEFANSIKKAGLSDAQAAQIKAARADNETQSKAIKNDKSLSKDDRKAKLKALEDDRNKKYETIMGKDNYQKFKESQKQQKAADKAATKS
ncbi:hypothetical protein ACI6Q2_22680 [Chitinophagaceae bacterium LWZ2-11]